MTPNTFYKDEILDFRPAPPGWSAYYLDEGDGGEPAFFPLPIVGWLIQAETEYHKGTYTPVEDQLPLNERPRTVAPAGVDTEAGFVHDVTEDDNFWLLRGPGLPAPTAEEAREELASRRRAKEARP